MNTLDRPAAGRAGTEPDEDAMRRFLVGDAGEDDRDAIEARMFANGAFYDKLSALEHEMLVLLARNELPARWAQPLSAAIEASADRRRRFDEVRTLIDALAAAPASAPRASANHWWLRAAAGIVLVAGTAGWWWASRPGILPPGGLPSTVQPEIVPVFALRPGPTRSPDEPINLIRFEAGVPHASLVAILDAPAAGAVDAIMRPVGGAPLALPATTTTRNVAGGLEVTWPLPASTPGGDYVISYRSAGATVGSRFVRVVK